MEIVDNALWMTVPNGNFGHLVPGRPMLEREVPSGMRAISISAAFNTEPDLPQDAWHGLFILGDDVMDWAVLGFAGESAGAQKGIVGSMFAGPVWEDKGHPETNMDVPFQLKLEKVDENYKAPWPTFMGNSNRTSMSSTDLPLKMRQLWKKQLTKICF